MKKKLFCIIFFALSIRVASFNLNAQQTFHVSPAASKNGNGTIKSPFNSIQSAQSAVAKMNDKMTMDIIVYLHGGTYTLTSPLVFKEKDSGANGHQIIYKAYNNEVPLLSGGMKITGWAKVEGNVYKASFDRESKLRTLFVNGKRMHMAGTNNSVPALGDWGQYKISGNEPWAFGAGTAIDGIKFNTKDAGKYNHPEDIELVQFNVWTEKILCAREIEQMGDTTVIKLQQPYGTIATNMAWAGKINYENNFIIRNAYELLDSPGEFYYNRRTKTIYFCSNGEDMATAEVIAPTSEGLISIEGTSNDSRVKNIRFEGITFSYDHWQLMEVAGSYGFAGIQSLALAVKFVPGGNWHPTQYNSTDVPRGTVQVQNAENIAFVRNRFEGISSAIAINLVNDDRNCEVTGNYFVDMLGNAVNIGHPQHYKIGDGAIFKDGVEGLCDGNKVTNNYLRNTSLDFRQVEGITSFFVANTAIEHNDISGTPYGAITCGWWWGDSKIPPSTVAKNNYIRFNKACNTHQVLDDGGIIYVLGEQPGSRIEGNYLFNGPRCIYPDDGSAYFTITQNVINNPGNLELWLHFWTKKCHDFQVYENYVKRNLLLDNSTNSIIKDTYTSHQEEFPDKALKIIENAGIQNEFKDIILQSEPKKISIYPEGFKEFTECH